MVRVIGGFTVRLSGRLLSATEVGSRKARAVLMLLAVQRGQLPVDRIAAALWGDVPPRDPGANIATLISRLRAALGSHTIVGGRAGYRLGDQVRVDLFEAADLVDEAAARIVRAEPIQALTAARRAGRLLEAGGVLPGDPEARWADPGRALHGRLLRQARHTAAEAALQVGDVRTARAAAQAATIDDAFDEAACRMLMRAHHAAGEPAYALLVYQRLRTTLATELGIDPAAATRDLHVAILRDRRDATAAG